MPVLLTRRRCASWYTGGCPGDAKGHCSPCARPRGSITNCAVTLCPRAARSSRFSSCSSTMGPREREQSRPALRTRLPCEFHLNLAQADLAALYTTCDLFVSAEKRAGWNNTVAEAMACGVPVVCTPAGRATSPRIWSPPGSPAGATPGFSPAARFPGHPARVAGSHAAGGPLPRAGLYSGTAWQGGSRRSPGRVWPPRPSPEALPGLTREGFFTHWDSTLASTHPPLFRVLPASTDCSPWTQPGTDGLESF